MGISERAFDCEHELREISSTMILIDFQSLILWFSLKFTCVCCKLILKKREYLLAVQRPKVMEKKLSYVCKPTIYYIFLQNSQAPALIFVF